MKTLRKTIRNILLEEFACASITNKNIGGGIAELERQGLHIYSAWPLKDYDSGQATSIILNVYNDLGDQKGWWMGEYQVTGENCLNAFQCTNTNVQNLKGTGVGALLYDVACELVGEAGLSSDRYEVSNAAWRMWQYMWENDTTYDKKAVYDWDGEQTPDNLMDDCEGTSWEDYTAGHPQGHKHPLNIVYVKKDKTRPTIKCLIEKGLIEFDGD